MKNVKKAILIGGSFSAGFIAGTVITSMSRKTDPETFKALLNQAESWMKRARAEMETRYASAGRNLIAAIKRNRPGRHKTAGSPPMRDEDTGYV